MRLRVGVGRNRAWGRITPALFLAALVLAVLAAWSPAAHYIVTGYRAYWREWVAVAAAVCAAAGVLLLARGPRRNAGSGLVSVSRFGPDAAVSPPASRGESRSPVSPWTWAAIIASLPAVTGAAGIIFTALNLHATDSSLQVTQQQLTDSERGQITDRYNAAVGNLGSSSADVQLGGIYALQHVMQDYPAYQPTVVAVLCAFARGQSSPGSVTSPDAQAALTVVGNRDPKNDESLTTDLDHAQLGGAKLSSTYLARADAAGAYLVGADLDNVDLSGANLTGAHVSQARLNGADLSGANLTGADLSETHPNGADLSGADLTGATLAGSILADVSLGNASFSGATLTGAVLAGDNAPGARFGTANLTGVDLSGANLGGAYLVGAQIEDGTLANAYLDQADFTGADLYDASLPFANLTDANLSYAGLTGVTANGANLHGADLSGADLSGHSAGRSGTPADLAGVRLTVANLTGADLAGVNLAGADLTGADLAGADLAGADLTNAILTSASLPGATLAGANLAGAYWPRRLTPPAGWQRGPGSDRLRLGGQS